MADISQTNWSEQDGLNNQAAPNGAPEGMPPSGVNDTLRAVMGATKRFWDRINGTVEVAQLANTFSLNYTVGPATGEHGETFVWKAPGANTGASTLNVGFGAHPIMRPSSAGITPLNSSDIVADQFVVTVWDATLSSFVMVSPPTAGTYGALDALSNTISVITDRVSDLSTAFTLAVDSVSNSLSQLHARITSLSACVGGNTTAINAVSNTVSVIVVRLDSLSATVNAHINDLSNTISVIWFQLQSLSGNLQSQINGLSNTISVMQLNIDAISNTVSTFNARINDISNTVSVIWAQLQSLSTNHETRINNLSATVSNLAIADQSISAVAAAAIRSTSLVIRADFLSVASVIDASLDSVSFDLQTKIDTISNTVSAALVRILSLSNTISVMALNISSVDARASSLNTAITSGLNALSNSISQVKVNLTSVDARVTSVNSALTSGLNALSNSISQVNAAVNAVSNTVSTIAVRVQSISSVYIRSNSVPTRIESGITNVTLTSTVVGGIGCSAGQITFASAFTTEIFSVNCWNGNSATDPRMLFSILSQSLAGFRFAVYETVLGSLGSNFVVSAGYMTHGR